MPTTKDRILDSAELLFSENGIAATSLRSLTEHAGVNLAAVNYHFQSKDALIQAVLFRRLSPINKQRTELLNAVLAQPPDRLRTVEAILDAFYRPAVEEAVSSRREGRPIAALIGRIYTEPGELLASQVRAMMSQVITDFLAALQPLLPSIPPSVLFWRMQFCIGILSHTFGALHLIEGLARGRIQTDDPEAILREMISFAAAGLRGSPE